MSDQYEDIINLPHHVSEKRPHMSNYDRAAQFSPFAALTGYDSAIAETARLTDQRIELSDDRIEAIDAVLRVVGENIDSKPEIEVVYFKQDAKKDGGAYLTVTGNIKKINEIEKTLLFTDGRVIPILDILSIRCDELSADCGGDYDES